MLLTITYTGENATDLGFLLHKNPQRPQEFELNHGKAYVFYPDVTKEKTTAALLLSIDPLDLARGKAGTGGSGLFDYVNDRPYVASSFMSTAISKVFGTAMSGRCDKKQSLADSKLQLEAQIVMLPCRSDHAMLNRMFEPLGYKVGYETFLSDEKFPKWGESKYVNLTINGVVRLCDLLNQLYVLIPVFDKQKHYWVDTAEVEKLLKHGDGWLNIHPERGFITGRYLNRKRSLVNMVLDRLISEDEKQTDETNEQTEVNEKRLNLNQQRLGSVISALKSVHAKKILDLGCGEGKLLTMLLKDKDFEEITGVDVSFYALEHAKEKLRMDRMSELQKSKINLFQGSLTYRDKRFEGYDAACVIEVIEHLDPNRLSAFQRVLFEFARPKNIILTTPNKEYNQNYNNLLDNGLRHHDHRFEWDRKQFRQWAEYIAEKYKYSVRFSEIGELKEEFGCPTQMGVFTLCE